MRLLRTRLAAVPFLYNFEEKSRWTIQFEVGIVAAAFAIASFLWKFSFAKNRGFEGGKFAMYSSIFSLLMATNWRAKRILPDLEQIAALITTILDHT